MFKPVWATFCCAGLYLLVKRCGKWSRGRTYLTLYDLVVQKLLWRKGKPVIVSDEAVILASCCAQDI